ncbi:transporter substrate-binding domain-containing protein [uncultured Thomasclavelia sp.]|uniref:transporter substrate-binding domain-containing protein n=1 Tax=uncultured Thomasclavelia sp. TaxID=3025759 RepID=UPI0025E32806|nr:transporter substrate-binding domain-containing protein [uncultured Thomasclavelia sp.]
MKRLLKVALTGIMALGLVGCGGSGDDSGDKVYTIGTDVTYPPFEMEVDGELVGVDMELLAAIAEDQGFDYKVEALGFDAAVTALESGEKDAVIAGMSITEERQQKYDFTDPYYETGQTFAVLADSDINSWEDLRGQTVVAKMGTAGLSLAEENADKYGYTVVVVEDSTSMFEQVKAGEAAACFEDEPVLGYTISQGTYDFKMPVEKENATGYGMAVMKGENSELIEMFNQGLQNIKDSGKYQEILDKYGC